MIPEKTSELVSCRCQNGYKNQCGCRKHGLKCTWICECDGSYSCTNVFLVEEGDFDENDDVLKTLNTCEADVSESQIDEHTPAKKRKTEWIVKI